MAGKDMAICLCASIKRPHDEVLLNPQAIRAAFDARMDDLDRSNEWHEAIEISDSVTLGALEVIDLYDSQGLWVISLNYGDYGEEGTPFAARRKDGINMLKSQPELSYVVVPAPEPVSLLSNSLRRDIMSRIVEFVIRRRQDEADAFDWQLRINDPVVGMLHSRQRIHRIQQQEDAA